MRRSSSNRLPWWLRLKRLPPVWETQVQSLGREDPLEKEMLTHSSILALETPGQRSLVGYSPRDLKESDTTERLHFTSLFTSLQSEHIRIVVD